MTTRAKGLLAGYDWLKRGINSGRHNPRAIFGGAALLAFAAIVPSVLQLVVQSVLQPGPSGTIVIAAVTTLLSVALLAPLMGGYLRVIHASEHGRPAQVSDLFAPFRSTIDARRLIAFCGVLMVIYLGVGYALVSLFGKGLPDWYLQVLEASQQAQQTPGGKPPALPPPPDGIGGFIGLGSLFALFVGGVFAIGFGQVALTTRSVGGALADGVAGAAKNLLPLLLLALLSFVLMMALGMALMIVVLVATLLSPALAAIVMLPLYLLLLLVLYVVMFGVAYQLWRDVADEAPTEPATAGGIEV
jgi:hypothetical protein